MNRANPSQALFRPTSMQPSLPTRMPTAPFEEAKSPKRTETKDKIEELLVNIQDRIGQDSSIAAEAVKRSLFGIFAQNYQEYKKGVPGHVMEEIFRGAFKGS